MQINGRHEWSMSFRNIATSGHIILPHSEHIEFKFPHAAQTRNVFKKDIWHIITRKPLYYNSCIESLLLLPLLLSL